MKDITIVTGPLRSGTSCLTGLLEQCGFDLGRNIRVLRDPTEHNPKGHFELDLLYTINERLLVEVPNGPWSIFEIPPEHAIADLASRRERYFRLFLKKFDGELCKDPLFCLTLPFWEPHWPGLRRVVFCLRHPLAVAQSMEKRYGIPARMGMKLWETYTTRFIGAVTSCEVFVFDFDAFQKSPNTMLAPLLAWLGRPRPAMEVDRLLTDFFGARYVHWVIDEKAHATLPEEISRLYLDLRSRANADANRIMPSCPASS